MTDPYQPDPWASPAAPQPAAAQPAGPSDQAPSDPFTVPVQPGYGSPAWTDPTAVQPPAPFVSPDATLAPLYAGGASPVRSPGPDGGYGQPAYPAAYPAPHQAQGYASYGGYGTQPGYYPYPGPPAAKTNGFAVASLVVSIIGAVLAICYGIGLLPGVVGAILGHVGRRQAIARQENGSGMALAGIIIGWIAFAIGLIVAGVVVAFIVYAVNSSTYTSR